MGGLLWPASNRLQDRMVSGWVLAASPSLCSLRDIDIENGGANGTQGYAFGVISPRCGMPFATWELLASID